jgi:phosphatidylinositol alpha-1,6-mannosyltransferase
VSALLVTENFPPGIGGTSRWFWELYRRVPRADAVVAAGACAGDVEFDRTHDLRVVRVPLSFRDQGIFSLSGWRAYRRAAGALRALCRQYAVRRLHCGRLLPEGWLALACRLPYGCYVHGEELASSRTSRQLTWMVHRVARGAAILIANSRHTAALLERDWRVAPARIAVLTPGVDTTRFTPAPPDEHTRAGFGWGRRPVVLTVARLQKRKGHDRMIDAIGLLRARYPTVLYAIVGEGTERAALDAQVRRAGLTQHVRFYGAIDDEALVRAYQQCDLFVLPNRTVDGDFEGFGIVLLEAQACARAVVAGDSGGTAEALCAGETGVVADCSRPEPLAAVVAGLLGDDARRARLGAAGRRWAVEHFDFDRQAGRAAEVLARVPAS